MIGKKSSNRLLLRVGSIGLLIALLAAPLFAAVPARAQEGDWEVVATGLNNPRGLTFAPDGSLYVAEAGTGGTNCYSLDPEDPAFMLCIGTTGSITRVSGGEQTRVAEGLPSLTGDEEGAFATGPTDISFIDATHANIVVGLGADPRMRDDLAKNVDPLFGKFGHLVHFVSSDNSWQYSVDVSLYEKLANPDREDPDQGGIDSNPYSVYMDGNKAIVVDAGANDVLRVLNQWKIAALAAFPPATFVVPDPPPFPELPPPGTEIPVDAVPTSVVKGPDGFYYVGQLASVAAGDANVYRVHPLGGNRPQEYVSGLTAIIDIAFAPDGSLYVLEIFKAGLLGGELGGDFTGALLHVDLDGNVTEIASEGLVAPGGLAIGPDGDLYVSNYSIFPGMGEVVRISPDYQASSAQAAPSAAAPSAALRSQTPSGIARMFGLDLNNPAVPDLEFNVRLPMVVQN